MTQVESDSGGGNSGPFSEGIDHPAGRIGIKLSLASVAGVVNARVLWKFIIAVLCLVSQGKLLWTFLYTSWFFLAKQIPGPLLHRL